MSIILKFLCIFSALCAIILIESGEFIVKFKEFMYVYAIGSIGYSFVEVLWRGYTHWSMGILGGFCFIIIFIIDGILENNSIIFKSLISAICVTIAEFLTGIIVNRYLKLNVWDYSQMKFNLLGQISLVYSIFWYLLCIPCHILCKILRHHVFGVLSQQVGT